LATSDVCVGGKYGWGISVKKVEEYLQHAAECRAMAQASSPVQHREQLEQMAQTWEQLAEARRRQIEKSSSIARSEGAD
jgi:hypothetical protein